MRPDLLADYFGRLAAKHVHVHHRLQGTEVDFLLPPIIPPLSQLLSTLLEGPWRLSQSLVTCFRLGVWEL
jgi:hypothetical protein